MILWFDSLLLSFGLDRTLINLYSLLEPKLAALIILNLLELVEHSPDVQTNFRVDGCKTLNSFSDRKHLEPCFENRNLRLGRYTLGLALQLHILFLRASLNLHYLHPAQESESARGAVKLLMSFGSLLNLKLPLSVLTDVTRQALSLF